MARLKKNSSSNPIFGLMKNCDEFHKSNDF